MTEYTASQKRKYLARVLRLNPVHQSTKIIQLRNQLLGKTPAVEAFDQEKIAARRDRAVQQIEEIRNQMWRQHPKRLTEMLGSIDIRQLPELKSAIEKLRLVIRNHAAITKLTRHPDQHINLTNTLKRVVMLPPRDSGSVKESYLRQIIESPDLKDIQKNVDLLQQKFPHIYAMESDWFESIQSLKRRKTYRQNERQDNSYESAGSDFEIPGWLIWVFFVIVFRVAAMFLRNQ